MSRCVGPQEALMARYKWTYKWTAPSLKNERRIRASTMAADSPTPYLAMMEIFSQEIAQLILRAATNERNNALNRMSLVGPFWHHLLAPPVGDCMPALTREVTLGEKDLLAVDQIGQGSCSA